MLKVRQAMESCRNHPMDGVVHVDEFVLGGVEKGKIGRSYNSKKKKAITAIQLTEDGKVKRMYAMRIEDFSARSLQYIFINNISRKAQVTRHFQKCINRLTFSIISRILDETNPEYESTALKTGYYLKYV